MNSTAPSLANKKSRKKQGTGKCRSPDYALEDIIDAYGLDLQTKLIIDILYDVMDKPEE